MVDTVVELLQAHPHLPMVCDPVLRAGGGGRLGKDEVGYAMRERLLPLAIIATPTCLKHASSPNCPRAAPMSARKNCCPSSNTC